MESQAYLVKWACEDLKVYLDLLDLLDMLDLPVSKESGVKRELEEKRESEVWMDFLASQGKWESREDLVLLV